MGETVRVGAVDMGSNATRFAIAESDGQHHQILERHRLPIRLGDYAFSSGHIPASAISDTARAFTDFRADCDRLSVRRIRAIATAAMRTAVNSDEMVARVQDASRIKIDVISGTEEASLLKRGVETAVDLTTGRSLLVDVGSGSVEIVVVSNGSIESANSYEIGALRLREMFCDSDPADFVQLVQQHLDSLNHQLREHLQGEQVTRCVGVGGNIDCLSDLTNKRGPAHRVLGVEACRASDLDEELRALSRLNITERVEQVGLRPDRADTIVPAGLIYLHLATLTNTEFLLVPRRGVMDGLIADQGQMLH